MTAPIKLIVFDFDGTLVDSQAMIYKGMQDAFTENGLQAPSLAEVRRVVGLSLEHAIAALTPEKAEDWDLACRVADSYRQAFHNYRLNPDSFHEPLFPDVVATLEKLRQNSDRTLAIATGKNARGLMNSLDHHGLRDYFSVLKTADDGHSKPHPDILLQAIAAIGVESHETVMIGDTTFDMAMGKAAKARRIGVRWGYHEDDELIAAGAEVLADNFSELPHLITSLNQTLHNAL